MSFEQLLLWVVNWLAGIVASWLQDQLGWVIDGRLMAIILSIATTFIVYAVAFWAGIPLFEDVTSPEALLEILLAVLMALGGSQTRYAALRKYERK